MSVICNKVYFGVKYRNFVSTPAFLKSPKVSRQIIQRTHSHTFPLLPLPRRIYTKLFSFTNVKHIAHKFNFEYSRTNTTHTHTHSLTHWAIASVDNNLIQCNDLHACCSSRCCLPFCHYRICCESIVIFIWNRMQKQINKNLFPLAALHEELANFKVSLAKQNKTAQLNSTWLWIWRVYYNLLFAPIRNKTKMKQ